MGRIDAIRTSAKTAQEKGFLRGAYMYAPGDVGRRWVGSILTSDMGFIDRTLSTKEAERVYADLARGVLPLYDSLRTGR
jgi:hypothetical protein